MSKPSKSPKPIDEAKQAKNEAVAVIEKRMATGGPFTSHSLWLASRLFTDDNELSAQLIQDWRERGLTSFVRKANIAVWSLTDAGREFVKGGGK